jgi:hypothetical protein
MKIPHFQVPVYPTRSQRTLSSLPSAPPSPVWNRLTLITFSKRIDENSIKPSTIRCTLQHPPDIFRT